MAGATSSSVSSMLKSAVTLYNTNQTLSDNAAAEVYQQSANTADDYNTYATYLSGQISKTSNPTKQLTYQKALTDAWTTYQSNQLQRDTQAVTEGNGTDQQKLSDLQNFYNQAVATGDMSNAQNIESEYLTTENAIATAQAAATTAANTLSSTQGTAYYKSGEDLETSLKELDQAYKEGGEAVAGKALKTFVANQKQTIDTLASQPGAPQDVIALSRAMAKGDQPDLGSVINGSIAAIGQYDALAATATSTMSDQTASNSYAQDVSDIEDGTKTFSTPYGTINYNQAGQIAANPNGFVEQVSYDNEGNAVHTLTPEKITGFVDSKGNHFTQYSGSSLATASAAQIAKNPSEQQLINLGFTVGSKNKDGSLSVQLTGKTGDWLKSNQIGVGQTNEELALVPTNNGYQFKTGDGKVYQIATDTRNFGAVYSIGPKGSQLIHGQYGFDQVNNNVVGGANFKQVALQQQIAKVNPAAPKTNVFGATKVTPSPTGAGTPFVSTLKKGFAGPSVVPTKGLAVPKIAGAPNNNRGPAVRASISKPAAAPKPLMGLPKLQALGPAPRIGNPTPAAPKVTALARPTAAPPSSSQPTGIPKGIVSRGVSDLKGAADAVVRGIEGFF
jgi:hypothetical protein